MLKEVVKQEKKAVRLVPSKKSKRHPKTWQKSTGWGTLSKPSKMIAKLFLLALLKWPPNIKLEEMKHTKVLVTKIAQISALTSTLETSKPMRRKELLTSQTPHSTPNSSSPSPRINQRDAGTCKLTWFPPTLLEDHFCGQVTTSTAILTPASSEVSISATV